MVIPANAIGLIALRGVSANMLYWYQYHTNMRGKFHRPLALACLLGSSSALFAQGFILQRAFLSLDDPGSKYGWSMAISDDHVVFGMPHASGQQGRVVVLPGPGLTWVDEAAAVIVEEGASVVPAQRYGATVATSGDLIAVGNCSAYGSDQYCNSDEPRSITILQKSGSLWQLVQSLAPPVGAEGGFGKALAMDDGRLAVGGCTTSHDGNSYGVVYLYQWNGTSFGTVPQDSLISEIPFPDDFGFALAMHDDLLAVGASRNAELGTDAGAVHLYRFGQGGDEHWGLTHTLLASNGSTDDRFGFALALRADRLVVGAPGCEQDGLVVGGAYVFARDSDAGQDWGEVIDLHPSVPHANMQFGASVAQSDVHIAVGAPVDANSDLGTDGSVDVFAIGDGSPWAFVQHIVPFFDQRVSAVSRAGTSLGFVDGALLIGSPFAIVDDLSNTPTGGVLLYRDPLLSVSAEEMGSNLRTWPNPFVEILHVEVPFQHGLPVRAELIDPLGRVVHTERFMSSPLTMQRQGLRTGPYVLRVTDGSSNMVGFLTVIAD